MGPKQSTQKSIDDLDEEVQYYDFVRKKNQRDKDKHELISNQKGTAYNKLLTTESKN